MTAPRVVPILRARIDKGAVVWAGVDGKKWETAKRFLEGKEVEITIQPRRKKRSLNQNSWYWSCIVPMIQEAAGYETPEETHEALKWHHLRVHTGPLPTVRSTSTLDTGEMVEYCESCRRLAAQMFGLYIPDPS